MEQELVHMETAVTGLYASAPYPLPFAPSLDIRAFLLRRDQGNLLVYSVTTLEAEAPAIKDLGGVTRQYLNHRHEAMFASDWAAAPLFCHESEREAAAKTSSVRGAFSRRHRLDDDFEVIPTPGHTHGATAFLWDSGEHRFLFTRQRLSRRWRVGGGRARVERSRPLRREPRAHPRARLRRARSVGRDGGAALLRRDQPGGCPAPHRRDPRARAAG